MKKCPNCGAQYADVENFCSECGEKLSQNPSGDAKSRIEKLEHTLEEMNLKISSLKPLKVPENLDKRIEQLEEKGEETVPKSEMKLVIKEIDGLKKSIDDFRFQAREQPKGPVRGEEELEDILFKKTDQMRRQLLDSIKTNSQEISFIKKKMKEFDKVKNDLNNVHKAVDIMSRDQKNAPGISTETVSGMLKSAVSREEFEELQKQFEDIRSSFADNKGMVTVESSIPREIKDDMSMVIRQVDSLRKQSADLEARLSKQMENLSSELEEARESPAREPEAAEIPKKLRDDMEKAVSQVSSLRKDIAELDKRSSKDITELESRVEKLSEEGRSGAKKGKATVADLERLGIPRKQDISLIISEIDGLREEVEAVKRSSVKMPNLKKGDVQELQSVIFKEFEKIDSTIKELTEQNQSLLEKKEMEIKVLKDQIRGMVALGDDLKSINMKDMMREFEALKQKTRFLEETLEKLDLEPFNTRIKEFETEIKAMRAQSPYILE